MGLDKRRRTGAVCSAEDRSVRKDSSSRPDTCAPQKELVALVGQPTSPRNFHCVYLVASTALVGRKNAYVPDRFPRARISGGIHVSETGYHCGRCDDYRESSETGCRILREDALRDRAWDRVLSYKRKHKTGHEATNYRVQARLSIGTLRPTHASVAAESFHRCLPASGPSLDRCGVSPTP
jgi:hypothetical protein